jgi:hypothetical protein
MLINTADKTLGSPEPERSEFIITELEVWIVKFIE